MRRLLLAAALSLAFALPAQAAFESPPAWTQPAKPFRIVGPIHYVGTAGIGVYLIETRDGLILLDGGMEESVPIVEANIAALGFRLSDVKLIVATHAHFDHAAGLAALKRDTGAVFAASPGDRQALETGTPPSVMNYGVLRFPPVKVDRELEEGTPVRLGEVALTPVFTPGHTAGCTTWTMRVAEAGRPLDVVFPCSMTVAGNKLIGNEGYPDVVADYRRTFAKMRSLPADVVLPAHPEQADIFGRARRRDAGDAAAFIAPDLLPRLVRDAEAAFEAELKKAQAQ